MKWLSHYLRLARPHHYIKNVFVFLPIFFGHQILELHLLGKAGWAFLSFSLAASSVYAFNDFLDVEADRNHPAKRTRPLPSGAITPQAAVLFAAGCAVAAMAVGYGLLGWAFLGILLGYWALNLAYSVKLKHAAVVDVSMIAVGFVLRVLGGGVASEITPSPWLIIMTFLLALFLALCRRRDEMMSVGAEGETRKSLDGYNLEFVTIGMTMSATLAMVGYIQYTVTPEITQKHGSAYLYFTSFPVVLGFLRIFQQVYVKGETSEPITLLLRDGKLQLILLAWIVTWLCLLYLAPALGTVFS